MGQTHPPCGEADWRGQQPIGIRQLPQDCLQEEGGRRAGRVVTQRQRLTPPYTQTCVSDTPPIILEPPSGGGTLSYVPFFKIFSGLLQVSGLFLPDT